MWHKVRKDEHPRSIGVQDATGEERRNSSERKERLSQNGHDTQLWICLVVKVKSDALKNNNTQERGMLGP